MRYDDRDSAAEHDLDAMVAEHEERALEESYDAARRRDATPIAIPFGRLRLGDYITADGERWAKVVKLHGPHCRVSTRQRPHRLEDGMIEVLFEIPEPVNLRSMETRYWITRRVEETVVVDINGEARRQDG